MSDHREKRFRAPVPSEKHETERQAILSVLEGAPRSAKEISGWVHISERQVYDHLEHIRRTVEHSGLRFDMAPAECKLCGFTFSKRDRVKKPGRCPVCRKQSISPPLFSVKPLGR